MAVWEGAARRGTVSSSSCPSLDSPRLTEYDQESPKYRLLATCRAHQLLPPSAQWSRAGCSSGDGDSADADGDGERGDIAMVAVVVVILMMVVMVVMTVLMMLKMIGDDGLC